MKNFTLSGNILRCRTLAVAAMASAFVGASAQSVKILDNITDGGTVNYELTLSNISSNHKYVTGSVYDFDNYKGGAIVYDYEAGEYSIINDAGYMPAKLNGVTENGVAAGFNDAPLTLAIDGTTTTLDMATGYSGEGKDISEDGSVIVGTYYSTMDFNNNACVWKDGVFAALPVPTSEVLGFKASGSAALHVSEDGSVIAGFIIDEQFVERSVVWTLAEDGTYNCNLIYSDYYSFESAEPERPYNYFYTTNLSRNGRYVSLTVSKFEKEVQMARYDLETGSLTVFEADGTGGIAAGTSLQSVAVANDGTMLGSIIEGSVWSQTYKGCVWRAGEDSPVYITSLSAEYADLAEIESAGGMFPGDITPDGLYVVGYALDYSYQPHSFVLELPNPATAISNAATTVDGDAVTARYTIDGKRVSSPVKGLNIVKKADGTVVKQLVK